MNLNLSGLYSVAACCLLKPKTTLGLAYTNLCASWLRSPVGHFIDARAQSIMAISSIALDASFLGLAVLPYFSAEQQAHGSIWPMVAGAALTIPGNIILLGNDKKIVEITSHEQGWQSKAVMWLHSQAKGLNEHLITNHLSDEQRKWFAEKAFGIGFALHTANGFGMIARGIINNLREPNIDAKTLITTGAAITLGCIAFTIAGFTENERLKQIGKALAPNVFLISTTSNAIHTVYSIGSVLQGLQVSKAVGLCLWTLATAAGLTTNVASRSISFHKQHPEIAPPTAG